MRRRYPRPVGTVMFPGFVPMERSCSCVKGTNFLPSWLPTEEPTTSRYNIVPGNFVLFPWNAHDLSSFSPSRAVIGTEQQVHDGPVMLRILSRVLCLRPWCARVPFCPSIRSRPSISSTRIWGAYQGSKEPNGSVSKPDVSVPQSSELNLGRILQNFMPEHVLLRKVTFCPGKRKK